MEGQDRYAVSVAVLADPKRSPVVGGDVDVAHDRRFSSAAEHGSRPVQFKIAQDLGFFAVPSNQQFLSPSESIDRAKFEEVRAGLGYDDLTISDTADALVTNAFRETIPRHGRRTASVWMAHGSQLGPFYDELRDDALRGEDRTSLVKEMKDEFRKVAKIEAEEWRRGW